jgi:GNAT superfamily N-acetyltransferase
MTARITPLAASDAPPPGMFEAIFARLDENSRPLIGPAIARPLVIPLRDEAGSVGGGFWGMTMFQWLHVQMLFVPEASRGSGLGTEIMDIAERDARERGCAGSCVDTLGFKAARFYERLGYARFGVLDEYPPGFQRIYLRKRIAT